MIDSMIDSMIDTVLFDLDGTLVEHGHVLLPPVLDAWGCSRPFATIQETVNRQVEWVYTQTARTGGDLTTDVYLEFQVRILRALNVPDTDGKRSQYLFDYFSTQPIPPLFADVKPLLAQLASVGMRMGVITQRERAGAIKFLGAHKLLDYFPTIIAGDDGYGRKPSPGPFLAAIADLNSAPARAVYVGDRIDDDCEGATAAGLGAFLIDREGQLAEVCRGRTDFVSLKTLLDLLDYLPERHP